MWFGQNYELWCINKLIIDDKKNFGIFKLNFLTILNQWLTSD